MDIDKKIELITRAPIEEIIKVDDLRALLENKIPLKHYIGFEISGFLHLGQGFMTAFKIADFQKAGVDCTVFLADFHAWINNKLGGNLETIQRVAGGYYKEMFKKCIEIAGGQPDNVKFILGSELYEEHSSEYLKALLDVSKKLTLARVQKSTTIMGRKEGTQQNFAMLVYPPMQVADIFIQGINLAHAGMDQRKAHVIAREVAPKLEVHPLSAKLKLKQAHGKKTEHVYKPIAVHHSLLMGLQKPPRWPIEKTELQEVMSSMKMSKSNPNSAVFLHDTPAQIEAKLMKAFCPAGHVDYNPVLNWAKNVIFRLDRELTIKRPKKFGGDVHFSTYEDLSQTFADGALHPMDLKAAVAKELIDILKPIRDHFKQGEPKKYLKELEKLKITR